MRGVHDLRRGGARRRLHRPHIRRPATLRPRISAQIQVSRTANVQVTASSQSRTRNREPAQVCPRSGPPGCVPREASRWPYVLAVKGTTSAYAADAEPVTRHRRGGPGRPPGAAYPGPPANLRQLAITHADEARPVTWRHGTKVTKGNPAASMTSQFLAIRVRPANRDIPRTPDGSLPDCWLLAEWPPHADEPTDYWLSTLPPGTPVAELIRLAKICWRIEHDYRELKHGLGLDHFERPAPQEWQNGSPASNRCPFGIHNGERRVSSPTTGSPAEPGGTRRGCPGSLRQPPRARVPGSARGRGAPSASRNPSRSRAPPADA